VPCIILRVEAENPKILWTTSLNSKFTDSHKQL